MAAHRSTLITRWLGAALALALGANSFPVSAVVAAEPGFETLEEAVGVGSLDQSVLDSLRAGGSADAIVTFDDHGVLARAADAAASDSSPGAVMAASRSALVDLRRPTVQALTADGESTILRDYDYLAAAFVRFASEQSLLAVLNRPEVVSVDAEIDVLPGTLQSGPLIRQPQAAALGYTGLGASVAVLDTGVDYRRTAFGICTRPGTPATCRVAASIDIAPHDGTLDDARLHGTNVAGIVTAIAATSKVVVLDVFRSDGTAGSSDIMTAIDWVIANRAKYNIRAMNLSLGSGSHTSSCPPDPGFRMAMAAGIVPVAAAGNSGVTSGVAWPACVTEAIAVGAVYDANIGSRSYAACTDATTAADRITCFSQSGPNLDLLAPGAIITAAQLSMAGTSQAAPHVSAAAAILAAANPTADTASVRTALVNHGPRISDPRNGVSVRRLDVYGAVTAIAGGPTEVTVPMPTPTPDPTPTPAPPPGPAPAPRDHPFTDIDDSIFEHDIAWIYREEITAGCDHDRYCPTDPVRRDQMASFLARAFTLRATPFDFFADDEGNIHEAAINRVAAAGITFGCAPNRYCPSGAVTREQMASFLARASNYAGRPLPVTTTDFFRDDDGSAHENDINRVAAAGITRGCTETAYCPLQLVTRGQMAAFLRRSLD